MRKVGHENDFEEVVMDEEEGSRGARLIAVSHSLKDQMDRILQVLGRIYIYI